MNKVVNSCNNCPFYSTSYDDFSVHGDGFTYTCGLAHFLKYDNYHIDEDENSMIEPPEMCPLKKEGSINLSFKLLSMQRVQQISQCLMEIEFLDIELNNMEFDNTDYDSKYQKLNKLCEKLDQLKSEE